MTDYRSPAATQSTYASNDPTAPPGQTSSTTTSGATGAGDTLGTDRVVKTGQYTTGLEPAAPFPTPVPVVGASHQNRISAQPGAAGPAPAANAGPLHTQQQGSGDGLAVVSGIGGPLGGSVVMGGQCECLRNGGTCEHGAGKCMCRGCTTAATTVNPGINIGVSTTQYTAPVGTLGLGGGVSEAGTQMAGVVNNTNTVGQPVTASQQNCECIKNGGKCACPPGECSCNNCKGHRQSLQQTRTTPGTATVTTTNVYQPQDYTAGKPVSGNGVV